VARSSAVGPFCFAISHDRTWAGRHTIGQGEARRDPSLGGRGSTVLARREAVRRGRLGPLAPRARLPRRS
jgi:hypothetical protein